MTDAICVPNSRNQPKREGATPGVERSATARRLLNLIVCALLLGAVLYNTRYYLAISPQGFIHHHEDDTFYYAQIAKNLVHGRPFTFDTINPTNGFHPLWVAFAAVLFFFSPDALAYTRLYFISQYFLFLACVALLFFLLLRITRERRLLSFAIAAYFGLDDYFFKTVINGLETPIFVLFNLVILCVITFLPPRRLAGGRMPVLLGLLMSALILSRLDGGLIHATAYCTALLILCRKELRLKQVWQAGAAIVLPVLAFAAASTWYNSSPVPVSGAVKQHTARPHTSAWYWAVLDFPNLYNWSTYYPIKLADALAVDQFARKRGISIDSYYIPRAGLILLSSFLSTLVAGVYLLVRIRNRSLEPPTIGVLTWFCLSAVALVLLNKHMYKYGIIAYWYPVTFSISQLLLLGYVLSHARLEISGLGRIMPILSAAALCLFLYPLRYVQQDRRQYLRSAMGYSHWFEAAQWLQHNTAKDDIAAAFNAGSLGFFSQRRVINLDGLVNSHAYRRAVVEFAGRDEGRYRENMVRFLRDNHVKYFVDTTPADDPGHWSRFFTSQDDTIHLRQIHRTRADASYCAGVYEISFSPGGAVASGDGSP